MFESLLWLDPAKIPLRSQIGSRHLMMTFRGGLLAGT